MHVFIMLILCSHLFLFACVAILLKPSLHECITCTVVLRVYSIIATHDGILDFMQCHDLCLCFLDFMVLSSVPLIIALIQLS